MTLTKEEKDDFRRKLSDKSWRLRNLYQIRDKSGDIVPFVPNMEQEEFYRDRANRNFTPKARQLGMSTAIVIDYGDDCMFPEKDENGKTKKIEAGHIDLKQDNAFKKLDMVRLSWDEGPSHPDERIAAIWKLIHQANPLEKDTKGELCWSNGCKQMAGISFTGLTPQRLHISEYGPISAQFPGTATQIKAGPMNAVPFDGIIDIETTMEGGQFGECYEFFKLALESEGKEITPMDWKIHFFSWVNHSTYRLPGHTPQLQSTREYFAKLEKSHGLKVAPDRQAWYEKKKREQQESIYQQYPTVIEECDRQIIPGQIYPEMKRVRSEGQVRAFNEERGYPRFTCWDLGSSDNMAGWEVQPAGKDHNWLAWCAGEGAGAAGVADVIRAWELERGPHAGHLIPHDAMITDKGSGKTFVDQLVECGIPRDLITVVPRIPDKWVGVDEVRKVLPNSWFHSRCDQPIETETGAKLPSGVQRIEGYRKKIDKSTGITRDVDVHDLCSHTADALRTYAEALSRDLVIANVKKTGNNVQIVGGFRGR